MLADNAVIAEVRQGENQLGSKMCTITTVKNSYLLVVVTGDSMSCKIRTTIRFILYMSMKVKARRIVTKSIEIDEIISITNIFFEI